MRLVLQIHDELVYEVAESDADLPAPAGWQAGKIARELCKAMESVVPKGQLSGVPIEVEIAIGEDWGNLKRVSGI